MDFGMHIFWSAGPPWTSRSVHRSQPKNRHTPPLSSCRCLPLLPVPPPAARRHCPEKPPPSAVHPLRATTIVDCLPSPSSSPSPARHHLLPSSLSPPDAAVAVGHIASPLPPPVPASCCLLSPRARSPSATCCLTAAPSSSSPSPMPPASFQPTPPPPPVDAAHLPCCPPKPPPSSPTFTHARDTAVGYRLPWPPPPCCSTPSYRRPPDSPPSPTRRPIHHGRRRHLLFLFISPMPNTPSISLFFPSFMPPLCILKAVGPTISIVRFLVVTTA